ncbi:MAG: STAS domain-containing protein [Candidatus Eisenbacteria bacterium]|uniref:STAS domain-containing protein n=1 Tax=Eiseniibacteriota bacterium TaxID=2212470 RepID=A0A538UBA3_UNCEI|nr:MAG: STAS domain-containing protein [Candidatus Eisenbacteria bacterium]
MIGLDRPDTSPPRPALSLTVALRVGRPEAGARVEWHERAGTSPNGAPGVARVALRGAIDDEAARRLARLLDDLVARGAEQVLVDCAALEHIDFRVVPALMEAFDRCEAASGGVVVCGLSRYLRDLFRVAGCESRLRCWPSAADLLSAGAPAPEPERERAS